MTTNNVQVKVRLQARGGKFLGPNVEAPVLTVRNAGGTTLFTGTFDNSASGTVVATPAQSSSRGSIFVQTPPAAEDYPAAGTYSLNPPAKDGQTSIVASFNLTEPALVEFSATAYTKNPKVALVTSTTLQLCPGVVLLDDPGLVLTIPGLIVGDVSATCANGTISVSATVTMMCGCPITPQPWSTTPPDTEPYWPSYEFQVTAGIPGLSPLTLQCTGVDTFTGSTTGTLDSGTHSVTVVAVQAAESNCGFAVGTLTV